MSYRLLQPRRSASGQGMIALSALIGLIMIPMIGILAFELARYQHGIQELQSNSESAALAGAAMLVTSQHGSPSERLLRFHQAEAAAANAFKSTFNRSSQQVNDVLGATLRTATDVGDTGALTEGQQVGDCSFKVEAVDPTTMQVVDPTSINAKAIRFSALFTSRPAFGKFIGITSNVPIYAKATATIPVLDVVVCFDVSGSMDDSTRISFINRKFTIPDPYRSEIGQQYQAYLILKQQLDDYQNGPSPNPAVTKQLYDTAMAAWDKYLYYRADAGDKYGKVVWTQVQNGTLADCVFNPLQPYGTSINCSYPENLDLVNWMYLDKPPANVNLQNFNALERYFQETGDAQPLIDAKRPPPCSSSSSAGFPSNFPCACSPDPGGVTDIVVKCDDQINKNPAQPLFGFDPPGKLISLVDQRGFTYTKKYEPYKGQSFVFKGVGYLTEAARGNLEPARFQNLKTTLFKNNIAANELPSEGKAGYQSAYFEMAQQFSQPMASAISAVENFYSALDVAGADVHFGFVAFETQAALNDASTTEVPIADIADKDTAGIFSPVEIDNTAPDATVRGPLKRPLLHLALQKIQDPSTPIADPIDGGKPRPIDEILERHIVPLRGTNAAAALKTALDMLNASPRKALTNQAVILMTDGVPTRDINGVASLTQGFVDARSQAKIAADRGVPIFTIGIAQNDAVTGEEQPFLGDLSSAPPAPDGLAALSGNGARFFQVGADALRSPISNGNNAISQALLNIARQYVQLVE